MSKLEPIRMLTLEEARSYRESREWGDHGVSQPKDDNIQKQKRCWAEVRIIGNSEWDGPYYWHPVFERCKNKSRQGFLTCTVHSGRGLAARELKCEIEGVRMDEIAYRDLAEKEADRQSQRGERRKRMDEQA